MVSENELLVLKHIAQQYLGKKCTLCEYEVLLRKNDYIVVSLTLPMH
jgi:hypothetical protein